MNYSIIYKSPPRKSEKWPESGGNIHRGSRYRCAQDDVCDPLIDVSLSEIPTPRTSRDPLQLLRGDG